MMKRVVAVAPYVHPNGVNFKMGAYEGWRKEGGMVADSHYPPKWLHGLLYRFTLPRVWRSGIEARLRFVDSFALTFDAYPDYAMYEIIPMFWDCWPRNFDRCVKFLKDCKVRTAVFTSKGAAEHMKSQIPELNAVFCPEAIDTSRYIEGASLRDRSIDLLEFGRPNTRILYFAFVDKLVNHVYSKNYERLFATDEDFYRGLADARITVCLPRSLTCIEDSGGLETLTQRYWECMLSRTLLYGHAPKELIDFVGYNPVVEADFENPTAQVLGMIENIESYQALVDKNREVALAMGDWSFRMRWLMGELGRFGYAV